MTINKPRILSIACVVLGAGVGNLTAQTDPGPRGGPAGAGGRYQSLNFNETLLFNDAIQRFKEVDSVTGSIPNENGAGLGPTFNGNSCAMCHAQPAVGGSSPGLTSKQNPMANPQVALAILHGATNTVPSFVTTHGPVREARFVNGPGGPDGGVHGLFTIKGRSDASGCNLAQPDFAGAVAANNVIFRIPTPTFGLGLVEGTPDATLTTNLASTAAARAALGIGGRLNTTGNDGSVTRFGWKAQNKSLLIFAGEAYNVEQGVSNEVFPNERSAVPGCIYNPSPEDSSNLTDPDFHLPVSTLGRLSSDTVDFALFMKLLAPPQPGQQGPSENSGAQQFAAVGCALCHTPTLQSGQSKFTGLSNLTYHPYSDFAIHHMGSGLADNVSQGAAGGDEFRSAPLWGVGQRLFFLHDGRASDLLSAIAAHSSTGSEANQVIAQFNALSPQHKQDILNFLRSL